MIAKHFDKKNLHHAYLLEGNREELLPEILGFLEGEILQFSFGSLKIEDARNLKSHAAEKTFSDREDAKKIFIISTNSILLEAQNTLLKLFEEPIENTHFFLITPDTNSLLKTFVSRFYVIRAKQGLAETKDAEKFIKMNLKVRLDFIKELLVEVEEEGTEPLNSSRVRALNFLNNLEFVLHENMSKRQFEMRVFEHIFKVRKVLRMPGSSAKTLLESVALITPNFDLK